MMGATSEAQVRVTFRCDARKCERCETYKGPDETDVMLMAEQNGWRLWRCDGEGTERWLCVQCGHRLFK